MKKILLGLGAVVAVVTPVAAVVSCGDKPQVEIPAAIKNYAKVSGYSLEITQPTNYQNMSKNEQDIFQENVQILLVSFMNLNKGELIQYINKSIGDDSTVYYQLSNKTYDAKTLKEDFEHPERFTARFTYDRLSIFVGPKATAEDKQKIEEIKVDYFNSHKGMTFKFNEMTASANPSDPWNKTYCEIQIENKTYDKASVQKTFADAIKAQQSNP